MNLKVGNMLNTVQKLLRKLGAFIGKINTFVLMTVSFYLILFPMAMIRRLFASGKRTAEWKSRPPLDRKHYEKQY